MGKSKLTPDHRKYAVLAFAAGCTPKAVHHDLEEQGAEITYSGVRAFRNRNREKIKNAMDGLGQILSSVDKNKRIAGREIDIKRIENRMASPGHMSATDYNSFMRTKNAIRDSIAKEQEGFTSKVSQRTNVNQPEGPEYHYLRIHKERMRQRREAYENGSDKTWIPPEPPVSPEIQEIPERAMGGRAQQEAQLGWKRIDSEYQERRREIADGKRQGDAGNGDKPAK